MSFIFLKFTFARYLHIYPSWILRPWWRKLPSLSLLPFPHAATQSPQPPAAKCWSWHSTTVPKERRAEGIGSREKGGGLVGGKKEGHVWAIGTEGETEWRGLMNGNEMGYGHTMHYLTEGQRRSWHSTFDIEVTVLARESTLCQW